MGLLYWGLILEALSVYGKKILGLIYYFFFKKKALLKIFWGLTKKHFGPYLLGVLGDGLSGLAIGPALVILLMSS
jgi:hypothetical protein